ncbi:MAG: hypothetical protein KDJ35_05815 [Alphaproteobacteria bacterium]|nr:hypothetical protein [Alphaproteobacteria bacterium]
MSGRGEMHKKSIRKRPISPAFNADKNITENYATEEKPKDAMPSGLCGALSKKEKAEMEERHNQIINKYSAGTSPFPTLPL